MMLRAQWISPRWRGDRWVTTAVSRRPESSALRLALGRATCRRSATQQPTRWVHTSSSKEELFAPIASQTNGLKHGSTIYGVEDPAKPASNFKVRSSHEHVLTFWKTDQEDAGGEGPRNLKAIVRATTDRTVDFLSDLFMPRDFRKSVTPDYFPYAKWYFMGTIASAASGVLSMQSLLYAIGLGAGSIPTAAAINWVLKDGLGQFGGVMFASIVNNRYDADPKRWRTASAVSLDAAVLLEILTPLCPAYFLPMASLANVAKNISWLSASATRAGFHNSFALRENLADITAKAGSQAIASSIIGTGLGIVISQYTGADTMNVLAAFVALSAAHQFSVYRALTCVSLRTFNCQRLHLVLDHFLNSKGTSVPHQDDIGSQERFMPLLFTGYQSLYSKSTVNGDATLAQVSRQSPQELLRLKEAFGQDNYLLNVTPSKTGTLSVDLALDEAATNSDALRAHLHAVLIQRKLEHHAPSPSTDDELHRLLHKCYDESKALAPRFLELVHKSEWHTENLHVEEKGMRYKWIK
ncbi:hypothetical protein Poli38472_013075 [Pythium oligandrum]|uniref:Vitamin B6 photo-protection and homoeostasis-domain-containing protein n=1 Tax=Pythium oligandrum TaxID=41045 RepID=A0A8K1FNA4_PYTOL|nr:hypothetical protein Poli38472_013075 [Pythium oligandrum]|eukprot:TMW64453.1 hypothetical protein Poli38472_013075 [Pythium oligandrum]